MEAGDRYNNLVALFRAERQSTSGNYYWVFQCDCGGVIETLPANVRRSKGGTVSCGCVQKARHHGKAWLSSMIWDYKKHAEKLGLPYSLSRGQFEQLVSEPCRYCGELPRNGIDRLDPDRGYVEENCVPCCKVCNYMKRKMSVMEFIEHVRKVVAMCSISSVI